MSREQNNGEDKPPVNLSNDSIDSEPTLKSGHPILSSTDITDRAAAVDNSSNDNSGDAEPSDQDEKVVDQWHIYAHDKAYPQGVLKEHAIPDTDDNTTNTSSELQSSDIEKQPTYRSFRSNDLASINDGALSRTTSAAPHAAILDSDIYPEGGLRAYSVVLGSFCGMTASFGILNSVGTFQAYLSTNQLADETPSAIGWVFSLYAFLTFFCGVQIGPIFDGKGPRWLVASGSICIFAGLMGVAESTGMWLLSNQLTGVLTPS